MIAGTGGLETSKHDMLWIVYKRPTAAEDEGGAGAKYPEERITLALYKPPSGSTTKPVIQLQSVREISWDLQLMQYPSKIKPTLADVIKTIQEQKK